jgi:hypothetical protein
MRTLDDPGAEPIRAEPDKDPPGPSPSRNERRLIEPPAGGPAQGALPPFLRALLRALSAWPI